MYGEEHDSHNEDDVDESCGNVKRKKSQQPKNNQNCSEHPKHVFNSFCRKVQPIRNQLSLGSTGIFFLQVSGCRSSCCRIGHPKSVPYQSQPRILRVSGHRGTRKINAPYRVTFRPCVSFRTALPFPRSYDCRPSDWPDKNSCIAGIRG